MTERFIIDDCGTLIDIETRNTYDYVSEVCPLLNQMNHSIETYKAGNQTIQKRLKRLADENERLKSTLAYRSNQLTLIEALIDDLGSEEMKRQMEDILE